MKIGCICCCFVINFFCVNLIDSFVLGFLPIVLVPDIDLSTVSNDLVSTFDALKDATTLPDFDTSLAYSVADLFSGAIGAVASREAANKLGDQKKDTLLTKVKTTSVYFGARTVIRNVETLMGMPKPLVRLTTPLIASIVSEMIKASSRGGGVVLDANDLPKREDFKERLDVPEIVGDMSKWLIYDFWYDSDAALSVRFGETMLASGSVDNFLQPQVSCFLIGGAAATAGAMISKILHKEQCISQTSAKELAKVALEGALLFGIFQITLDLCEHFVPDNFNFPLGFTLFENVLKKLTGLEATK